MGGREMPKSSSAELLEQVNSVNPKKKSGQIYIHKEQRNK
jgi:hypothetical protein